MSRIAFIRSVDVKQAQPMLKKMSGQLCKDNVLKLFYSERNCTKEDFYGEIEYFMEGISEEKLAKRIINWCPDLVVSISLPDNNAVRDASLSRFFSKNKIPYIMHPLESVMILSNKWDTVRFLRKSVDSKLYSRINAEIKDPLFKVWLQLLFIYNAYLQGRDEKAIDEYMKNVIQCDFKVSAHEFFKRKGMNLTLDDKERAIFEALKL